MKLLSSLVAAAVIGLASAVSAATIGAMDASYTNTGWLGSAQSLTPVGSGLMTDIAFTFDAQSAGKTFQFTLASALTGGVTYFSQAISIVTGLNTIATNLSLTPGSTVYAILGYNGFNGATAAFGPGTYADGLASFWDGGNWASYSGAYDLAFTANFGEAPPTVPVPAAGVLLLAAMGGLTLLRRKRA